MADLTSAWAKVEVALPEDWAITDLVLRGPQGPRAWRAIATRNGVFGFRDLDANRCAGVGRTPVEALSRLAEELDSRRG